jgi:hypothetical protein
MRLRGGRSAGIGLEIAKGWESMSVKFGKKRRLAVAILGLGLSLMASGGCSDVNSKVAGPGGGPSSGAAGSTSREGGYLSGTNSQYSENVNSGGSAASPR